MSLSGAVVTQLVTRQSTSTQPQPVGVASGWEGNVMRSRKRKGWRKVINGVNISAFFIVLFIVLPLYWLIVSSFKIPASMGDSPPQYFPNPVSGSNYSQAFVQYDFGSYFI